MSTICGVVEGIIGSVWENYKAKERDTKVKSINRIIEQRIESEDDMSNVLGKVALSVVQERKEEIL